MMMLNLSLEAAAAAKKTEDKQQRNGRPNERRKMNFSEQYVRLVCVSVCLCLYFRINTLLLRIKL